MQVGVWPTTSVEAAGGELGWCSRRFVSVEDVSEEIIAKEREIEAGKEDLANKPEAIRCSCPPPPPTLLCLPPVQGGGLYNCLLSDEWVLGASRTHRPHELLLCPRGAACWGHACRHSRPGAVCTIVGCCRGGAG